MRIRNVASGIVGVIYLTQAGTALAEESPPLPISRPLPGQADTQNDRPPSALSSESDQVRNPQNSNSQVVNSVEASTRNFYRTLIKREAEKNGLPPDIADAVAAIESGYDPGAVGGVGEIGLMQVRPETAAMMGFTGDAAELAKPDINIHYGVTYLGQAWRLANGDLCRALMKYRAGHGEEMMSALSANYCGRARAHLASVGSPFAAGISVPFVFEPAMPRAPAAKRGPRIRTAAVSRAFWAAQEARVKAITKSVEAKWRRMASR